MILAFNRFFPPTWCTHYHAYFGLLLLCGVDDGSAAYFSDLASFSVERPTADLIPEHVFDKQDAAIKSQHEFVKQFDVLQQVIVRVAERERQRLSTEKTNKYLPLKIQKVKVQ